MGADETLPVQAPASGADMKPEDKVFESAPDSAFIPISASAPESVEDTAKRKSTLKTRRSPLSAKDIPPLRYPPVVVPEMEPRIPGMKYHAGRPLPSQPRAEREAERQKYGQSGVFKD